MNATALARTKDIDRGTWLSLRQQGIGGSDVAALLGLSPWKSPMDLWVEKTMPLADDTENEAMYWGTVLESIVAGEFQKQTGYKIRRCNYILQHKQHPFMLANIDREIIGLKEKVGLECKTASEYSKNKWTDDEIPAEYLLQCQHYMAVTGYSAWWIAVLIGGNKFIYKKIARDEEIIQTLIEAEAQFWHNYVETKTMPPADGSDACTKALAKLYPKSNGQIMALDSQCETLLEQRLQLKEQADRLEQQLTAIENTLKAKLGDAEIGETNSFRITWKTTASNRVDTKALKEQYPDIYKACLKTSESRRFTVKEI